MEKGKWVLHPVMLIILTLVMPQMVFAASGTERQCCKIGPGEASSFQATNEHMLIDPSAIPANVIVDGSFENGSPNPDWNESSTNFGTPLCTVANCGTGTGTGPNTGLWWAWFGGTSAFEEGVVSQSVPIPSNMNAVLKFQLEAIVCADPSDFLEIRVDGNQEWVVYGSSPLCGTLGYGPVEVDMSAYADGASHLIEFHSITNGNGTTNFFVDDVELNITEKPEIPTINHWGLITLVLIIFLSGMIALKRSNKLFTKI